ncbi:uncharacterized protein C8A04DRAFT_26230 [Dichotomopilus funicola]|uniref:Uncharacterized protein n=1 Tax=Dichotomopilus funicola TaxID=1934379 RepID=A0AAN6V717_9PEZI|nr:hypothetical protein C8A04DRAFT_26230 [Dichotomopilus funicola]
MAMVVPEPGGKMPEDSPNTGTTAMLVAASVIGGVAVILCTLAVYLYIVKRKQLKRDLEALQRLTEIETAPLPRQRKRGNSGLSDEEESCRTHMIRKSLARRNSNSTGSGFSAVVGMIDREVAEIERHESARLKDDWKEWEARAPKSSTTSKTSTLAISDPITPQLAAPEPALSVLDLSKSGTLHSASSKSTTAPSSPELSAMKRAESQGIEQNAKCQAPNEIAPNKNANRSTAALLLMKSRPRASPRGRAESSLDDTLLRGAENLASERT